MLPRPAIHQSHIPSLVPRKRKYSEFLERPEIPQQRKKEKLSGKSGVDPQSPRSQAGSDSSLEQQEQRLNSLVSTGLVDTIPNALFLNLEQRMQSTLGMDLAGDLGMTPDRMRQIFWRGLTEAMAPAVEEDSLEDYLHGVPDSEASSVAGSDSTHGAKE